MFKAGRQKSHGLRLFDHYSWNTKVFAIVKRVNLKHYLIQLYEGMKAIEDKHVEEIYDYELRRLGTKLLQFTLRYSYFTCLTPNLVVTFTVKRGTVPNVTRSHDRRHHSLEVQVAVRLPWYRSHNTKTTRTTMANATTSTPVVAIALPCTSLLLP
jgi:hypothetical protein